MIIRYLYYLLCCTLVLNGCKYISPDNKQNAEFYNLSLEELMEINLLEDTSEISLQPTYDIPIEDLMKLEIVNDYNIIQKLNVSFNVPFNDFYRVELPIRRKSKGSNYTYEVASKGELELEVDDEIELSTKIRISYDISLEGLMQIEILDIEQN